MKKIKQKRRKQQRKVPGSTFSKHTTFRRNVKRKKKNKSSKLN